MTSVHSILCRADELSRAGDFEATYELCAGAMERGIDHVAIRLALARALGCMGYQWEARVVLLSAMVRGRRKGDLSRWARTWISSASLDQSAG